MENLNVIEILKVGLPGLVFLLSVLSFKLLTREQIKKDPSHVMLKSIKHFMYINIFLAILTAGAPFIDKKFLENQQITAGTGNGIEDKTVTVVRNDNLGEKIATVCKNADYINHWLLIVNPDMPSNMIKVKAEKIMPCDGGNEEIHIASLKGKFDFDGKINAIVAFAPEGFMFP